MHKGVSSHVNNVPIVIRLATYPRHRKLDAMELATRIHTSDAAFQWNEPRIVGIWKDVLNEII